MFWFIYLYNTIFYPIHNRFLVGMFLTRFLCKWLTKIIVESCSCMLNFILETLFYFSLIFKFHKPQSKLSLMINLVTNTVKLCYKSKTFFLNDRVALWWCIKNKGIGSVWIGLCLKISAHFSVCQCSYTFNVEKDNFLYRLSLHW